MMKLLRKALGVDVGPFPFFLRTDKGVASEGEGAGRCLEKAWNVDMVKSKNSLKKGGWRMKSSERFK